MTSMHMPKATMGTFTSELPSMSHRLGLKDSMLGSSGHFKYPYGSYDHYLHEAGIDKQQATMASHTARCHADDQYNDDMNGSDKYEEMRAPALHDRSSGSSHDDDHGSNDQPSQSIDYNSERFFDDVFLQISPDYGCLV
jgi:hypothetical protein